VKHLDLLLDCVKSTYKGTAQRLESLLTKCTITYDLPWALFKPGQKIYTTCKETGKPRSLVFDFGEEKKTKQSVQYFKLTGRYLDFDGQVFGEVEDKVHIMKFRGAISVTTLAAFPLQYHSAREAMETHLQECGRKFINMMTSYHCHYQGVAFFMQPDGSISQLPVDGRIMVDAHMFRKVNPGYPKLQDKIPVFDMFTDTSADDFLKSGSNVLGSIQSSYRMTTCLSVLRPCWGSASEISSGVKYHTTILTTLQLTQ
jgi:hypothetical protein